MKIYNDPPRNEWDVLTKRPRIESASLDTSVRNILDDVRKNGDEALVRLTKQFDKIELSSLQINEVDLRDAEKALSSDLKNAIKIAAANIKKFHEAQISKTIIIETMPGVKCWQKSVAIERVGLYVPGGSAPLFSTVLMLGIPAVIAGCKEIVLCTPPDKSGKIHPAILYSATIVGIKKVFAVGGAQAIAAMAYGTASIPKVDKIFGPGNQFVTAAKQIVSAESTAIDMPAGPSEVLVIADETADPSFVSADLLSQAEHGADSQVILVSQFADVVNKVIEQVNIQVKLLPRKELAERSLANSKAFVFSNENDVIDFTNTYAPEHLILSVKDEHALADKIINAGSVFLGHYATESIGDYASGTNHTLPTYGWAKAYNGVNLDDYVKKITFQHVTEAGLQTIGPVAEIMAATEHLDAHKNAVSIRLQKLNKK